MSVCAWVTTALVVLQNKQSLAVVSDERSSPLKAVDQFVRVAPAWPSSSPGKAS